MGVSPTGAGRVAPGGLEVAFFGQRLHIPPELREQGLITVWIATTYTQFRGDEMILYPLALYFAAAALRDRERLLPVIARGLILFAFPAWWLLSVFWSEDAFGVIRSGVQLVLTMVICTHAALWLSLRRMMVAVFLASLFIGVLSFGEIAAGGRNGVFAHKNALGAAMTVLWIVALAVALDGGFSRWFRLLACGAAAMAAYMIVGTESATALVLFAGGSAGVAAGAVFFGKGTVMRPGRIAILFLAVALVCAALFPVIATLRMDLWAETLSMLGKDATLTGRTGLWEYAREQIETRPLLGTGPGGFWDYQESPLVRRIYAEYYKLPHHVFHFHNSVLEIWVHLGLVGVLIAVATLGWGLWHLFRGVVAYGGMPLVFFCTLALSVTARAYIESDFLMPFVLMHMLIWMSALRTAIARGDGELSESR